MDGWNTAFLLGWPIFRGELLVSGSVIAGWRPSQLLSKDAVYAGHEAIKKFACNNFCRNQQQLSCGRKQQQLFLQQKRINQAAPKLAVSSCKTHPFWTAGSSPREQWQGDVFDVKFIEFLHLSIRVHALIFMLPSRIRCAKIWDILRGWKDFCQMLGAQILLGWSLQGI